jgi:hypothetical protein
MALIEHNSIIPNKPLFIVSSALNSQMGVINQDDRLDQTLDGLKTLRKYVPEAIILLADGSPVPVQDFKIKEISEHVDFIVDMSGDEQIVKFAINHRKSEAENVLMIKTMMLLKKEPAMMKLMHSVNRIFKLSARTDIHSSFKVDDHLHFGKYVFKKRMPTWIQDSRKSFATDLLITRFFSMCPSLIDEYISLATDNINLMIQTRVDTEHAHFVNIRKDRLVELDEIHCQGVMAGTGDVEVY